MVVRGKGFGDITPNTIWFGSDQEFEHEEWLLAMINSSYVLYNACTRSGYPQNSIQQFPSSPNHSTSNTQRNNPRNTKHTHTPSHIPPSFAGTRNPTLHRIRRLPLNLLLNIINKVLIIISHDVSRRIIFADDIPARSFCKIHQQAIPTSIRNTREQNSLFSPAQSVLPQPTLVVLLQTNCVKCPVPSLNPGFAQLYCSLSKPHASTAAETFA